MNTDSSPGFSSPPPLEFIDVVKFYDDLCAVNHVSFSVNKGEVFGLLGPNGAGKTTSISMITTIEKPTSGEVKVFGTSVLQDPICCKKQFGAVPQETVSHGFFNVEEILTFHSGYYGIADNTSWIRYLLDHLILWPHRHKKVAQLSGGMKKRLAIAKALVHKPPLLLLDEPTAGVDIDLRDTLWAFIDQLRNQGTTILLTTHYLIEAEKLCDRVAIIDEGRIKKLGETHQLIAELTMREVTITYNEKGAQTIPQTISSPYLIKHDKNKNQATFRLPSNSDFQDLFKTANICTEHIRDIQIREGSLEDVVRQIVTFENHR